MSANWIPTSIENWRSWPPEAKLVLLEKLKARASTDAPTLRLDSFVETTTRHRLDLWQRHLCGVLSGLAKSKGRRLLIAAPPQAGKSIIVSQRFPAWLVAQKPTHRIKLACYNITHAARFGRIVRDLMQSGEYAAMFPNPGLRLPTVASTEEWSTSARRSLRDCLLYTSPSPRDS